MTEATPAWPLPPSPFAGSDWFDPLEEAVRSQVRSFIEQLLEEELERAPPRASAAPAGHDLRPPELVGAAGSSAPRNRRAGVEECAFAGLQAAQPWLSATARQRSFHLARKTCVCSARHRRSWRAS